MDSLYLPAPHSRRIAVIGNIAGGKTRLARRLAILTQLPLHHIDALQFVIKSGELIIQDYELTAQRLTAIHQEAGWIIDGYGPLNTLEERLLMSDTIFFIDLSYYQHLLWLILRQFKSLFSPRKELPPGAIEFSWKHFRKLYLTQRKMHRDMRPEMLKWLQRPQLAGKTIHIRSVRELNRIA